MNKIQFTKDKSKIILKITISPQINIQSIKQLEKKIPFLFHERHWPV